MHAGIIIAGGPGTRLRPLTDRRPKHLVPVANRPFLEYQISWLRHHGVREIVFATSYMAGMIEAYFGDGSAYGVDLAYAVETEPLGTAGAIRSAAAVVPGVRVIALNGDILSDFDLRALADAHEDARAEATIALTPVHRPHPFGVVELDDAGHVTGWREPAEAEKAAAAAAHRGGSGPVDQINAGIYVLEPDLLARIPLGRPVSLEREVFPARIGAGAHIAGVTCHGYWADIGRPDQLLAANRALLGGRVGTQVEVEAAAPSSVIGAGSRIDEMTSLAEGSRVGRNCTLHACMLLAGASVGDGSVLTNVIVEEGASVPAGTARGSADAVEVITAD